MKNQGTALFIWESAGLCHFCSWLSVGWKTSTMMSDYCSLTYLLPTGSSASPYDNSVNLEPPRIILGLVPREHLGCTFGCILAYYNLLTVSELPIGCVYC